MQGSTVLILLNLLKCFKPYVPHKTSGKCCKPNKGRHVELFGFNPTAQGLPIKHINLLLCGGVGSGNSSIVATIDSLCQGRISRRAPHGTGMGTGSLTRKLRKYESTLTAKGK